MKTEARWLLLAGLWLPAVACGSESDEGARDEQLPADTGGYATEPIALRPRDVERYLTVMREVRRAGLTGLQEGSAAVPWAGNPDGARILAENEFDVPGFRRVAWSIMLAMAADDLSRTGAQDSLARPPANLADSATRRAAAIHAQPAGNVELVRRYRADILALHR